MAEPLKNLFDARIPRAIARMIAAVHADFPAAAFLRDALDGYEPLALMQRGQRIAAALRKHLPDNYEEAVDVLVASLPPERPASEREGGMAPFLYLPHTQFVATYGLDHFEASMRAQYELTKRFTAEFSIRPFLERYPDATLGRLREWAADANPDVRRLVSEGTRPRLPWGTRLRAFVADPRPVLSLLELLKDDPDLVVRRSVANNLNDIGKDHPDVLVATARRWLRGATPERKWIVGHALRSAVKRAEPGALQVLGYGDDAANVRVGGARFTPPRPRIGEQVRVAFTITNATRRQQRVLIDLRVHFVKASGKTSAKVFKLKALDLAPGEAATIGKSISLAQHTTRKHYPGNHAVEVVINGRAKRLGAFTVRR